METGPLLHVSSDSLVKPGIEPATPGLQGKWLIHYTTAAPIYQDQTDRIGSVGSGSTLIESDTINLMAVLKKIKLTCTKQSRFLNV